MTRPEDALEAARAAAERRRAAGGHAEPPGLDEPPAAERPTPEQLREWALIEVDPDLLRSTRRLGRPITGLKRALLRLLRQYTIELEAQQTRFNVGVLAHLRDLERRVERMEAGRAGGEPPPAGDPPPSAEPPPAGER